MKNFYINNKNTCFFLLMLWSLSLFSLGCSSIPSEKRTLVTYQSIGVTLDSAKTSLRSMCIQKQLTNEQCRDAREAYNKAVTVYKEMGVAYSKMIDTGDDTQYRNRAVQLSKLLIILNGYLVTQ